MLPPCCFAFPLAVSPSPALWHLYPLPCPLAVPTQAPPFVLGEWPLPFSPPPGVWPKQGIKKLPWLHHSLVCSDTQHHRQSGPASDLFFYPRRRRPGPSTGQGTQPSSLMRFLTRHPNRLKSLGEEAVWAGCLRLHQGPGSGSISWSISGAPCRGKAGCTETGTPLWVPRRLPSPRSSPDSRGMRRLLLPKQEFGRTRTNIRSSVKFQL